eukprot:366337-Chlamydomonas_euryale.AAC.10
MRSTALRFLWSPALPCPPTSGPPRRIEQIPFPAATAMSTPGSAAITAWWKRSSVATRLATGGRACAVLWRRGAGPRGRIAAVQRVRTLRLT